MIFYWRMVSVDQYVHLDMYLATRKVWFSNHFRRRPAVGAFRTQLGTGLPTGASTGACAWVDP